MTYIFYLFLLVALSFFTVGSAEGFLFIKSDPINQVHRAYQTALLNAHLHGMKKEHEARCVYCRTVTRPLYVAAIGEFPPGGKWGREEGREPTCVTSCSHSMYSMLICYCWTALWFYKAEAVYDSFTDAYTNTKGFSRFRTFCSY